MVILVTIMLSSSEIFAQRTMPSEITVWGRNKGTTIITKENPDGTTTTTTTINCDSFWDDKCYTIKTSTIIVGANAKVKSEREYYVYLITYRGKEIDQIQEGYLEDAFINERGGESVISIRK